MSKNISSFVAPKDFAANTIFLEVELNVLNKIIVIVGRMTKLSTNDSVKTLKP